MSWQSLVFASTERPAFAAVLREEGESRWIESIDFSAEKNVSLINIFRRKVKKKIVLTLKNKFASTKVEGQVGAVTLQHLIKSQTIADDRITVPLTLIIIQSHRPTDRPKSTHSKTKEFEIGILRDDGQKEEIDMQRVEDHLNNK